LSCTRLNKSSTFKKLVCQLLLLYLITAVSAVIVLPGYEQQAYVRTLHLVAVRRILSENGLMEAIASTVF
ncbi:MAG: hypothetical protein V7K50_30675, partial [Nostoc sp.]